MGTVILPKQSLLGEVKVIDPQPIWIGIGDEGIKRFMNRNAAIQWLIKGKNIKLVKTEKC